MRTLGPVGRLVVALLLLALPLSGQALELRFLDVGQGDALVIREGGKTALVDAGPSGDILRQLRALGIDTLDLVVASHNHADHIGGMTAVLTGSVVRYYLDNGVPHTTATYRSTIRALAASGAQYLRPTSRTITLGAARMRVLPPPSSGDQNNASVGLLVEYGAFRALLTGDSELYELDYWLRHDSVPRVQVVKVAHHGSRNGTSAAWVRATAPAVAVISVGAGNSYGHPAPSVVQQWQAAGARVHRTDVEGTVLILANRDGSFVVTTARERTGQTAAPGRACCRICTRGKACGNTCISRGYTCRQPPGCACDARP
ncbi:MAG TPA: ComEC/Rec2 family competence protein [Gemmatimonadales bacterium]|nr:ComEC/Rec2 family competence protein [Gemmatimonadales bacterium]